MPAKYGALTDHLRQSTDADVKLSFDTLDSMVGGLPMSARTYQAWWSNNPLASTARAWLAAGRKARVNMAAGEVVFHQTDVGDADAIITRTRPRSEELFNGVDALTRVLERAGYPSVVAGVAEHTVFLDPRTVEQTGGQPLFPVIRDMIRRGDFEILPNGQRVLLDDNTTPNRAFLWAAGRSKGRDLQYNHVWSGAKNPALYTALWNLCATPAFLAKTTDGQNHPEVRSALQYRAYELYGVHPAELPAPQRPASYDSLTWAPMPGHVPNLEVVVRARMAAAPKSRPALAAREIGWLFSGWEPDMSLAGGNVPRGGPGQTADREPADS